MTAAEQRVAPDAGPRDRQPARVNAIVRRLHVRGHDMWYRRFVCGIVCLGASGFVNDATGAQPPSIVGHVVDAMGQALPGVSVTTIPQAGGSAKSTTTGRDGTYRFERLPNGTYRVDFDLPGFDLLRRNHVRVRSPETAEADGTLPVSALCECIDTTPAIPVRERDGQVMDESGRPLPHARLEIVGSTRREVAYADGEGRFRARLPADGTWPLSASDTGFAKVTERVSGTGAGPAVLTLPRDGKAPPTPDTERFSRACRCSGDLFTHAGR
jgi:hypothetical protein